MGLIGKADMIRALQRLVQLADAQGQKVEQVIVGGTREAIWESVSPYLVPGSELKAEYAFADLWEETHGRT